MLLNRRSVIVALTTIIMIACAPAEEATPGTPIEIAEVGFATPESVLHDPVTDRYLVSNINGNPLMKDDNGFISRLSPTGEVEQLKWIDGERDDVTLHAPKGMALMGDTLFVADIDAVRLFDRESGAALGERPVPGATFLNDLTVGTDGLLYVTDSGLRAGQGGFEDSGTDALWRFEPDGTPRSIVSGPGLGRPNGIVADSAGITVVTFGSGTMYRVDPATGRRTDLGMPAQGQLDGVVRLSDGSLLVSSWAASAVYRLSVAGEFTVVADSVPAPADIGYDVGRGRLLIPLFTDNRVLVREVR